MSEGSEVLTTRRKWCYLFIMFYAKFNASHFTYKKNNFYRRFIRGLETMWSQLKIVQPVLK